MTCMRIASVDRGGSRSRARNIGCPVPSRRMRLVRGFAPSPFLMRTIFKRLCSSTGMRRCSAIPDCCSSSRFRPNTSRSSRMFPPMYDRPFLETLDCVLSTCNSAGVFTRRMGRIPAIVITLPFGRRSCAASSACLTASGDRFSLSSGTQRPIGSLFSCAMSCHTMSPTLPATIGSNRSNPHVSDRPESRGPIVGSMSSCQS